MEKKKAVFEKQDGNQLKYKLNHKTKKPLNSPELVSAPNKKKVKVLSGLNSKNGSPLNKGKKGLVNFKPVIVTVFSAIIVGCLLGFFMIRLFVNMDSEMADRSAGAKEAALTINEKQAAAPAAASVTELPPLQAYILQAGIFSTVANAEEWALKFETAGIDTLVWERDGQFFLIAGATVSQEEGKALAESYKLKLAGDGEADLYVKEWSTAGGQVEIGEADSQLMEKILEAWNSSMESGSVTAWNGLSVPEPETEELSIFISAAGELGKQESLNGFPLLKLMHEYEKIMK